MLPSLLQLQHVKHAARRQGQHQAAREELHDFKQWLDAAVQQLAAEQAQLAAELAEDVQQARQQEASVPAEEQTLEGPSRFSSGLCCSAWQLRQAAGGTRHSHHAAGKMKHVVSALWVCPRHVHHAAGKVMQAVSAP